MKNNNLKKTIAMVLTTITIMGVSTTTTFAATKSNTKVTSTASSIEKKFDKALYNFEFWYSADDAAKIINSFNNSDLTAAYNTYNANCDIISERSTALDKAVSHLDYDCNDYDNNGIGKGLLEISFYNFEERFGVAELENYVSTKSDKVKDAYDSYINDYSYNVRSHNESKRLFTEKLMSACKAYLKK